MKKLLSTLVVVVICFGCTKNKTALPTNVTGYKPVYSNESSLKTINYTATPHSIEHAGKIYYKAPFIYQVDNGLGIHIIDATNASQAKRIGFMQVKGCQEISIQGNNLYTNNYQDLVVINIAQLQNPQVISRTQNVFTVLQSDVPPERGYFECIDLSKGIVVGWYKDVISEANCNY